MPRITQDEVSLQVVCHYQIVSSVFLTQTHISAAWTAHYTLIELTSGEITACSRSERTSFRLVRRNALPKDPSALWSNWCKQNAQSSYLDICASAKYLLDQSRAKAQKWQVGIQVTMQSPAGNETSVDGGHTDDPQCCPQNVQIELTRSSGKGLHG